MTQGKNIRFCHIQAAPPVVEKKKLSGIIATISKMGRRIPNQGIAYSITAQG